ncbi:RICIN domain-containing protein [Streptomyces sp. NPDC002825]|uniref:RICIN domain-containing protein n=1 Tax=Streptomyces sp. NPDC002825 TaxID=3154666 RepID=UPI0033184C3D
MTAGRQLTTTTAGYKTDQKWQFARQSDGSQELANVRSGLCADVNGGSTSAGATVIQWQCCGDSNQRWNVRQLPDAPSRSPRRAAACCSPRPPRPAEHS